MIQTLQHVAAYGCLGFLIEIIFTGLANAWRRNWDLKSTTYLWMFAIYGPAGVLLETTHGLLSWPGPVAALVYTLEMYAVEFGAGWLLKRLLGRCPWEYSKSKFSIMGLIRLDYFPFWYGLAVAVHYFHPTIFKAINALSKI